MGRVGAPVGGAGHPSPDPPLLKGKLPKLQVTGWRPLCRERFGGGGGPVWHRLAWTGSALLFTYENHCLGPLAGHRDWQGQSC